MNSTKKTLTTLSAAVALALGGIAVAQTAGSDTSNTATPAGASAPMQSDTAAAPSTTNSSDLGSSSSSTLSNNGSTADMGAAPAPQVDRN